MRAKVRAKEPFNEKITRDLSMYNSHTECRLMVSGRNVLLYLVKFHAQALQLSATEILQVDSFTREIAD